MNGTTRTSFNGLFAAIHSFFCLPEPVKCDDASLKEQVAEFFRLAGESETKAADYLHNEAHMKATQLVLARLAAKAK